MLERFQEENPGFDFSQAQFSGNAPDPKTFMVCLFFFFFFFLHVLFMSFV
jgi:hypothetical protein